MEDLQQSILNSDVIYALTRNLPNPELISDEALNDSDKTLTVPADQIWEILSIWLEFTSTATVGNREIRTTTRDSANDTVFDTKPGIIQSASKTFQYLFAPSFPRETAVFASDRFHFPYPRIFLPASFNLRLFDAAVVDVAADDLIIQMMVNRYDVP